MMSNRLRHVVVLGSTGSIGQNTVLELDEHRDCFSTVALVARNSIQRLADQAVMLNAPVAVTTDPDRFNDLKAALPPSCRAMAGEDVLIDLVTRPETDVVLCAILGTSGIRPVLAALAAGKTVALASKEVLCLAGELVMKAAAQSPGGRLVPVDSEHSGLFQCLQGRKGNEIAKLWITASGGAFRNKSKDELRTVTVSDALKHPTWSMGAKITIDSASLMNKALELVEAHFLFDVPEEKLEAIQHTQSCVHAMAELTDGSFIAQLSAPDMRMAIRYGLTYPERLTGSSAKLDLGRLGQLNFAPIDDDKFPALAFARKAIHDGGTMPAIMNAANDVANEQFRLGTIPFTAIWNVVEKTMDSFSAEPQQSLEQLEAIDKEARIKALQFCGSHHATA